MENAQCGIFAVLFFFYCFLFSLFWSLGPSSMCTELWDDVLEQHLMAQREETPIPLYIDWQHPICSVHLHSTVYLAVFCSGWSMCPESRNTLFLCVCVILWKRHTHVKVGQFFLTMNNYCFSAQKYETVMHKFECIFESLYRPQRCVCEAPPLIEQVPPSHTPRPHEIGRQCNLLLSWLSVSVASWYLRSFQSRSEQVLI